jgi:hypothetical protein
MSEFDESDPIFDQPPPTYKQIFGIVIVASVGVVLGMVAASITAVDKINIGLLRPAIAFVILAPLTAGFCAWKLYRQRKAFLRQAMSLAMDYEESVELATARPEHTGVTERNYSTMLHWARGWRDYFIANSLDYVAEHFQRTIIRAESRYHSIRGEL